MRTLFYSPGSCSLAVQVALEWTSTPYHLVRADAATRARPGFARVNPLGKVPVLAIEGRILAEVNALLVHVARVDPELLPMDDDGTQQWLSYLASELHVSFSPWFHPERFHPDVAQHDAVKEMARANIRKQLAYLEPRLEHLPGRMLEPYVYAMVRWARKIVDLPAEFPHVDAFLRRLEQDPAVAFALATERGDRTASSTVCLGHLTLED